MLKTGSTTSTVRVIRTIGGMAEERSLLVGIFLADISEIVLLMHTDCGCCLAYNNIDVIISRMARAFACNKREPLQSGAGGAVSGAAA